MQERADSAPGSASAAAPGPRLRRSAWLLLVGLTLAAVVVVWAGVERNDSIRRDVGVGVMGPMPLPLDGVFSAYYGPYHVEESLTLRRVRPLLSEAFRVEALKVVVVGPVRPRQFRIPYGCKAVGYPSAGRGRVEDVSGTQVAGGEDLYVVAYLRAMRTGVHTTEAPVLVEYTRGWLAQRQVMRDLGVYVLADVSPNHESQPDLSCHVP